MHLKAIVRYIMINEYELREFSVDQLRKQTLTGFYKIDVLKILGNSQENSRGGVLF